MENYKECFPFLDKAYDKYIKEKAAKSDIIEIKEEK